MALSDETLNAYGYKKQETTDYWVNRNIGSFLSRDGVERCVGGWLRMERVTGHRMEAWVTRRWWDEGDPSAREPRLPGVSRRAPRGGPEMGET